jgi:hypothetical protein
MSIQKEKARKQARYASAKEASAKQKESYIIPWLNIPSGLDMFKFKDEKKYRINVISFVTGVGNPMADEGVIYYERTCYVHQGLGLVGRDSHCCLFKMWGKKCPVCERVTEMQREGRDDNTVKSLRFKKRQLWLFDDVSERKEGQEPVVQLYESSYFGGQGYKGFGELIDMKIDNADDDDLATRFHRRDEGASTLKIMTKQRTYEKHNYYTADDLEFVTRKENYSDEFWDAVPCLDVLPKQLDYETLLRILDQTGSEQNGKTQVAIIPAVVNSPVENNNGTKGEKKPASKAGPDEEEEEEDEANDWENDDDDGDLDPED